MTMKEIEALSGMTRANIRFYEKEGLLSPARNPNGYRDYTEDDLEVLKRIRLLRTLRISLEEIKALHHEENDLISALDRHIAALDLEREDIDSSRRVCCEILNDGVNYRTLDAQKYLDSLDFPPEAATALADDTIPAVRSPWRRLFARILDLRIYSTFWEIFLMLVCNVNITYQSNIAILLEPLLLGIMILIFEPVLLTLFGTTPGKWLLGLRVTDAEGRRLSYSAAVGRTWEVILRGFGLFIPIYQLVRMWKCYKACSGGEMLCWEYDSVLSLRDEKKWRALAWAASYASLFLLFMLAMFRAEMPHHRGDITTAEFCDNFNRLLAYHGIDYGAKLDESGKWVEEASNTYTVYLDPVPKLPYFVITETNGAVTSVRFQFEMPDNSTWVPDLRDLLLLSAHSLVCAPKGRDSYTARTELIEEILSHYSEDFSFSVNGFTLTCDVEYSGYDDTGIEEGLLWAEEGAQTSYVLDFQITKDD